MTAKRFWSELPKNPDFTKPCPPPQFDQFAPPKQPTEVHCLQCGLRYDSRLIAWGRKIGMQIAGGVMDPALWWCPSPLCDGGGFGHDIYPLGIMGGKDARPLTSQTVAEWNLFREGSPLSEKEKRMFRLLDIHSEWLLEQLKSEE